MKKLLMSLLLVGGGFVGLVRGAEQMAPAELAIWERQQDQDKVPSLQMLCLKKADELNKTGRLVIPKEAKETFAKLCLCGDAQKFLQARLFAIVKSRQRYSDYNLLNEFKKNEPFLVCFFRGVSVQDYVTERLGSGDMQDLLIESLEGVSNLVGVRELSFMKNLITKIPSGVFNGLLNITLLNLSHNQIKEIVPGAFDNLPALWHLNLSFNQITEIAPGAFDNLPALVQLYLTANQITEIAPGAFSNLPALKLLSLSGNPGIVQQEVREQLPESTRVFF